LATRSELKVGDIVYIVDGSTQRKLREFENVFTRSMEKYVNDEIPYTIRAIYDTGVSLNNLPYGWPPAMLSLSPQHTTPYFRVIKKINDIKQRREKLGYRH